MAAAAMAETLANHALAQRLSQENNAGEATVRTATRWGDE
jgi:hypothetical protein